MELRQLQYFAAVAEELHFGRAAERLRISQPPLSLHIKRLEEEIGVRLFTRSTRKVALTQAGEAFRDRVELIQRGLDEAVRQARDIQSGTRGTVRVGFVSSANYALLPPVVRHFRSLYPDVQLDLRPLPSSEQIEELLAGGLDVGLLRDPNPHVSLRYTPLVAEELVAVLPDNHELATRPTISVNDLVSEPMIFFPYETMPGFVSTVLGLFEECDGGPRIVQRAVHQETIMGLVAAGVGFSILPETVVNMSIRGISIVRITSSHRTRLMLAEPLEGSGHAAGNFVECLKEFGDSFTVQPRIAKGNSGGAATGLSEATVTVGV